jgi:hypothetical protein
MAAESLIGEIFNTTLLLILAVVWDEWPLMIWAGPA